MATAPKQAEKEFEPVTFWLADPRNGVRIAVPSQPGVWLKFIGGKFTARTQEEYDLVKENIGHKSWEQDMTKAPKPHPLSGYSPMSSDALDAHIELMTMDTGQ